MRIAVTYENGEIYQHFGHTESFMIYDCEGGQVVRKVLLPTNGSGHGALAGLLWQIGANELICGGIGGGARVALEQAGIMIYGGCFGKADDAVQALLAGTLTYNPAEMCSHHSGEHSCGEHDCGSHGGGCGHHEGSCGC